MKLMEDIDTFFRLKRKGLTFQLIAANIFIIAVVLTLNAILTYDKVLSIVSNKETKITVQTFKQIEYGINYRYRDLDNIIKSVIGSDWIQNFLENDNIGQLEGIQLFKEFNSQFSTIMRNYKYINSVYLFKSTGTIFGIDRKFTVNIEEQKSHPFYQKGFYRKSEQSYPELIFDGNLTPLDYLFESGKDEYDLSKKNISAARCLRSFVGSKQSASLVINTDETSLSTLYEDITEYNGIYIVNSDNIIISHTDKQKIGEQCKYTEFVDNNRKFGDFTLEDSSLKKQIVYYKLDDFGWMLVSEVPYNMHTKDVTSIRTIIAIPFLISILSIIALYSFWTIQIIKPLKRLTLSVKELGMGNIGINVSNVPHNELGILMEHFNTTSNNIKKLIEKNKEIEEDKRNLEIEMLQSQINPHFLYNTLNMVKWMAAVIDARNIVNTITMLGKMLKIVFSKKEPICTIREEIEFISNYINIINLRYDNDIHLNINAEDKYLDKKVIRFILQPIIENSVVHGFGEEACRGGDIGVDIKGTEKMLTIEVYDNGKGMPEELVQELNHGFRKSGFFSKKDGWGIGLDNVNRRIILNYGINWGIKVIKIETGSKIIIEIPIEN